MWAWGLVALFHRPPLLKKPIHFLSPNCALKIAEKIRPSESHQQQFELLKSFHLCCYYDCAGSKRE
jgi:hypothetical protein